MAALAGRSETGQRVEALGGHRLGVEVELTAGRAEANSLYIQLGPALALKAVERQAGQGGAVAGESLADEVLVGVPEAGLVEAQRSGQQAEDLGGGLGLAPGGDRGVVEGQVIVAP